jgi:hypothetical protein
MEKIRNNLPVLSAVLIFIGYLNHRFFYNLFDIEIETYLTTTELIFSFLPLTIPFLIVLTFLLFMSFGFHLAIGRQDKEFDDKATVLEEISTMSTAWSDLVRHFKRPKKTFFFWFGIPFSILLFLMKIGVQIFLVIYVYIFLANVFKSNPPEIIDFGFFPTLILGIVWIVFLTMKIDKYQKEEAKNSAKVMTNILILTIAIGILKLANQESAKRILDGNPKYSANIEFNDNSSIKSDSTVVYIGQTNNYIFFRDIPNAENIIFKMDNVKNLKLTLNTNATKKFFVASGLPT